MRASPLESLKSPIYLNDFTFAVPQASTDKQLMSGLVTQQSSITCKTCQSKERAPNRETATLKTLLNMEGCLQASSGSQFKLLCCTHCSQSSATHTPSSLFLYLSFKTFSSLPLPVHGTAALLQFCCLLFQPQHPSAGSCGEFKIFGHHSLVSLCKQICGEWWGLSLDAKF